MGFLQGKKILVTGLLSILAFAAIQRFSRLREDASIGIVLSVFYALGVIGLSLLNKRPSSGQAGLESLLFGKISGMLFEDVVWIGGLAIVSLAVTAAANPAQYRAATGHADCTPNAQPRPVARRPAPRGPSRARRRSGEG